MTMLISAYKRSTEKQFCHISG